MIIFNLYAVVRNFAVKVGNSLLGSFSDVSYLCVVTVYNDCHETNQNHRSRMGWTSHLSDTYDTFSSSCALESDDDDSDESDDESQYSRYFTAHILL